MSVNPFNIKTIVVAKHAQHVVLIDFAIALFVVGVLFDLLAQRTRRRGLAPSGLQQLPGSGTFGAARPAHRRPRLAVRTRGREIERRSIPARGPRVRSYRADLVGVVGALAQPEAGRTFLHAIGWRSNS